MIIFGDINSIPKDEKYNLAVYNLSSFREGLTPLYLLPDLKLAGQLEQKDFDIFYANFIFSDDQKFYEFFGKLIYNLYAGIDIYVAVARLPILDAITESLMKLIQQRYGYTCALINEPEDIDYINDSLIISAQGIYNLDQDKERYTALYAKRNASHIKADGSFDGKQEFI